MTLDQILAALDEVKAAVHQAHPDAPRLDIFDAHMATTRMNVEHIYDEAFRAGKAVD